MKKLCGALQAGAMRDLKTSPYDELLPPVTGQVILVDDDLQVLRSLHFLLEVEGMEVLSFTSGYELLTLKDLPYPACFVIDYFMPGMNGVELIERLRDLNIFAPAILITGGSGARLEAQARKAGVEHFIRKPHLDNALIESICTVLKRH